MALQRVSKHFLIIVSAVAALAVLCGALLLFTPQFTGRAFAASQKTAAVTCRAQPNSMNCEKFDPVHGECVAPSTTTISQDIVDSTDKVVGRVDRRFSSVCNTWWGRVFDYRHIKGAFITIQVGNTGYTLPFNAVAYTDMVFDLPHTPAPAVTGTLTTNGKPDPKLSATIAAA